MELSDVLGLSKEREQVCRVCDLESLKGEEGMLVIALRRASERAILSGASICPSEPWSWRWIVNAGLKRIALRRRRLGLYHK